MKIVQKCVGGLEDHFLGGLINEKYVHKRVVGRKVVTFEGGSV